MKVFEDVIEEDIEFSAENPMSASVLLLGDFNLEPRGSKRIYIPRPSGVQASECSQGDPGQVPYRAKRWEKVFDKLTEISTAAPTHYYPPQTDLNQIDRIFTSVPRSSINLFQNNSGVVKDPVHWFTLELSDHSPVFWCAKVRTSKPQSDQRIRPEWCCHPVF